MAITLKTRSVRERVREKYVHTRARSATRELENKRHIRRSIERGIRLKPEQQRLKEQEKKKLLSEIQKEKHPDKLREKMELAKQHDLQREQLQKDKERLEKMEKARERLKENIRKMKSHEASANTKEAIQDIQAGRSETAMRKLKEAGHDGALGNDIADESSSFAKEAKVLAKETGKHFDSIMYKTLKENSVPADTINAQIRQDKSDQNLEGAKTKDSTLDQMVLKKLQDRKMR